MFQSCSSGAQLHHTVRKFTYTLIAFLCGSALLFPSLAWSIPAPKGVKIGSKGKFHPRLYFNFGYDSNVFTRSNQSDIRDNSPEGNIVGAPYLSIRPGIELDIPTDSVEFYLGGYANYTHFFPFTNLNTITAKADVSLKVLPKGVFSFEVYNNFSRNTGDATTARDTFAQTLFYYAPGTQTGSVFITHNNTAGVNFNVKPGGGSLLFDFGYAFNFGIYPNTNLDHHVHGFHFNVNWKFFPRTAFTFESDFRIVNFAPGFNTAVDGSNVDSMPLRLYVGMAGQLTERIILRARIGSGYTFAADRSTTDNLPNDNYTMVIGNVDFTYQFRLTTFIRLGFAHTFDYSQFSNFMHETSGYVEFKTQFGPPVRPFQLGIRASGGYLGFGKIPVTVNVGGESGSVRFNSRDINDDDTINRADFFVRGQVDFDWYPFPFWMVGITGKVAFRNSNTFVVVDNNNQLGFGFFKFDVLFKTEVAY